MNHLWINKDSNTLRYNFMNNQLSNNNFKNTRVSAITPSDFDKLLVQKRPLTCKYPGCTTCEYEFACLSSHIKAMIEGLKTEDEYFIILEDDIILPFYIKYEDLIKELPDDAEIIQMMVLYDNTVKTFYQYYKEHDIKYIKWKYLLPSTGMYIISRKGAEKIVNLFYNKKTNMYDYSSSPHQIVADVLLYSTANTYCMTLPYCYPNINMGSDIHPDHLHAHSKAINEIKKVLNDLNDKLPFIIKKNNI